MDTHLERDRKQKIVLFRPSYHPQEKKNWKIDPNKQVLMLSSPGNFGLLASNVSPEFVFLAEYKVERLNPRPPVDPEW